MAAVLGPQRHRGRGGEPDPLQKPENLGPQLLDFRGFGLAGRLPGRPGLDGHLHDGRRKQLPRLVQQAIRRPRQQGRQRPEAG